MKKRWMWLVIGTSLSMGCTTKVVQTPGGPVECYSNKCVNEAKAWVVQHDRQTAKAEQEAQEHQEKEARLAHKTKENEWKNYNPEKLRLLAKENQIALYLVLRDRDGHMQTRGIDLTSFQYAKTKKGETVVMGQVVHGPKRSSMIPTFTHYAAVCETFALITPYKQLKHFNSLEQAVPVEDEIDVIVFLILCSRGQAAPDPYFMNMNGNQ